MRSVVSAGLAHPSDKRVVVEDASDPFSQSMKVFLRGQGCELRSSSWPRMRNLRGPQAAKGIWDVLADVVAHSDLVAKVDSDVMILGDVPRVEASNSGPGRVVGGVFYQLPAGMVRAVREEIARDSRLYLDHELPSREDLVLDRALKAIGMRRRILSLNHHGLAGRYTGHPEGLKHLVKCPLVFAAIGRKYWTPGRREVAGVMDELGKLKWGVTYPFQ